MVESPLIDKGEGKAKWRSKENRPEEGAVFLSDGPGTLFGNEQGELAETLLILVAGSVEEANGSFCSTEETTAIADVVMGGVASGKVVLHEGQRDRPVMHKYSLAGSTAPMALVGAGALRPEGEGE